MVTSYTENPDNFYEVSELVESEAESIKEIFFSAKQIFFYDACSFQRHSNLPDEEKNILINYFKVISLRKQIYYIEIKQKMKDLFFHFIDFSSIF